MFSVLASFAMDGEIAAILNSAFVVPVAGCLMIASIGVAGIWSGVRTRELRSHERLALIAQGLTPEPEAIQPEVQESLSAPMSRSVATPWDPGAKARRAGMVLCGVGIGIILFFAALALILAERDVLSGAAVGILPAAIGAGFLVDARVKKREYEAALVLGRVPAGRDLPSPPPPQTVPPPPLLREAGELTPAQASDWRPSA